MAMAIPSAADLNERVALASDRNGTYANCYDGASVYVSHGIGNIAPHATIATNGRGEVIERDHASRFDAYLSALQHVAGML